MLVYDCICVHMYVLCASIYLLYVCACTFYSMCCCVHKCDKVSTTSCCCWYMFVQFLTLSIQILTLKKKQQLLMNALHRCDRHRQSCRTNCSWVPGAISKHNGNQTGYYTTQHWTTHRNKRPIFNTSHISTGSLLNELRPGFTASWNKLNSTVCAIRLLIVCKATNDFFISYFAKVTIRPRAMETFQLARLKKKKIHQLRCCIFLKQSNQ